MKNSTSIWKFQISQFTNLIIMISLVAFDLMPLQYTHLHISMQFWTLAEDIQARHNLTA